MKKLIALLCLLVLAGCSDAYASVKNPNEVVFKIGTSTMTRGELYSYMQAQDAGYTAINMAMENILNAKVEVTEEMKTNVDETLNMYKSLLGENIESYIVSMGYASVDAFKEDMLLSEQAAGLTKNYIEVNFELLCSKYAPKKVKIATFTNQETALKAQTDLKNGADFAEVSETYSSTSSKDSIIYTTQSSYPTVVTYAVSSLSDGMVSDVVATDDAKTFYIIVMESVNALDFKDEAVTALTSISTIGSDALMSAFDETGFSVYDKNLYDAILTNYPDYLSE